MQTVTSETESKSHDLSICVHRYTLRAHQHAVASGYIFRSRRRRRSLSGSVGGGAGRTRFLLVDIGRHARFLVGPPRLNGVIRGGRPPRGSVAWVGARPQCGRAAENFGGVAPG